MLAGLVRAARDLHLMKMVPIPITFALTSANNDACNTGGTDSTRLINDANSAYINSNLTLAKSKSSAISFPALCKLCLFLFIFQAVHLVLDQSTYLT